MPGLGNYDVQYTLILKDQMTKTLAKAEAATKGFNSYLTAGANQMAGMFSKANVAIAGAGVVAALVGKAIKEAMDFEQVQVQMEVMLGSAEKANKLLADIEKFAAITPFESKDLINSTKLLLNYGVAQDKVMPVMKQLGDITAGDSEKLKSMSIAFGQMSSTGRLMGQDLNQMINAGFNPLEYIAKRTGKSVGELKEEMARGNISVAMVEQAFADATAEGGRFNGMMEKQSKTMGGQWSTAMDTFNVQLREAGGVVLPKLTGLLTQVNDLMSGKMVTGEGYLKWMKNLTQTITPVGWAWSFVENKMKKADEADIRLRNSITTLGDKMAMVRNSSLEQFSQGLSTQTGIIEMAANATETQLTAALDRAQKMYGITSDQIDKFMEKVTQFKKMTKDKENPLTVSQRTTDDLENQIKDFKDLENQLTGTPEDMKKRRDYQKQITGLQKEISRREGGGTGKSLKGGGVGSEGTTVSSRAPQYFTITIDQLVGTINTKKETFNESDEATKKQVTEALVTALNDTQLIASNK
jgi:tape measure domain-containing protein